MDIQKVMIGVPSRGAVMIPAVEFLCMQASKGFVSIVEQSTMSVEHSRGKIVSKFLKQEHFTHLFFMDDDIACPDTIIEKLLARDVDVCGAKYPLYLDGKIHSSGYRKNPQNPHRFLPYPMEETGFKEVDAMGTGAMLIKREVLERTKTLPCFRLSYGEGYALMITDDITFCKFCKNLGFKLYVDFDIKCDHFKTVSLNYILQDFNVKQ